MSKSIDQNMYNIMSSLRAIHSFNSKGYPLYFQDAKESPKIKLKVFGLDICFKYYLQSGEEGNSTACYNDVLIVGFSACSEDDNFSAFAKKFISESKNTDNNFFIQLPSETNLKNPGSIKTTLNFEVKNPFGVFAKEINSIDGNRVCHVVFKALGINITSTRDSEGGSAEIKFEKMEMSNT